MDRLHADTTNTECINVRTYQLVPRVTLQGVHGVEDLIRVQVDTHTWPTRLMVCKTECTMNEKEALSIAASLVKSFLLELLWISKTSSRLHSIVRGLATSIAQH